MAQAANIKLRIRGIFWVGCLFKQGIKIIEATIFSNRLISKRIFFAFFNLTASGGTLHPQAHTHDMRQGVVAHDLADAVFVYTRPDETARHFV